MARSITFEDDDTPPPANALSAGEVLKLAFPPMPMNQAIGSLGVTQSHKVKVTFGDKFQKCTVEGRAVLMIVNGVIEVHVMQNVTMTHQPTWQQQPDIYGYSAPPYDGYHDK